MRELTDKEFERAPDWATHYYITRDDDVLFENSDKLQVGMFGYVYDNHKGLGSDSVLIKKEPNDQALLDLKHILTNCEPGSEAEAVLFAIKMNKITNVIFKE